jgi:phage/plasmid-like protein (TIGR03299 family)
LFGGKKFWATAEVGKTFDITPGDTVNGFLLLVTSADGTTSTQAKFCSTRTVCNNTLTVALAEGSKNVVKKTHASEWDARAVKLDLGLIDTSWETFAANMKKLAEVKVDDSFAKSYFEKKFYNPSLEADKQTTQTYNKINKLFDLYANGNGSDFSKGTANGVLQACTDAYTHGLRAKQDDSRKFWESSFGRADTIKNEVYSDMLALTV